MKKSLIRKLMAVALLAAVFCLLAPPLRAQTLSISGTNVTQGAYNGNVGGSLTLTNVVNGYSNTASIVVFYGGYDAGTITAQQIGAWQGYLNVGGGYTNNQVWSGSLTNISPGTRVYWRARANDGSGSAWLGSSVSFTSSSPSTIAGITQLYTNPPPSGATNVFTIKNGVVTNIQ